MNLNHFIKFSIEIGVKIDCNKDCTGIIFDRLNWHQKKDCPMSCINLRLGQNVAFIRLI